MSVGRSIIFAWLSMTVMLGGCDAEPQPISEDEKPSATVAPAKTEAVENQAERTAYFGELHVHTQYSFDAFIFGTRSTPDTAYEYAKGQAVMHPSGFKMQLRAPLDFQAVTDNAMYMGMLPEMDKADTHVGQHPVAMKIREAKTPRDRIAAFQDMFPYIDQQLTGEDDLIDLMLCDQPGKQQLTPPSATMIPVALPLL